jgi:hypothetical protein
MRPSEFDERREELGELYALYFQWEREFWENCARTTPLPWMRALITEQFRPLMQEHFEMWFLRLPLLGQQRLAKRWRKGFAAWQQRIEERATAREERIRREGIPAEVRKHIEDLMREIDESGQQIEE